MGAYSETYRRSLDDPEGFWLDAARAIDWTKPPTKALDASREPFYRWFPDGELNTAYNALDRHADSGRGGQPALIWDSPVTGQKRRYTYAELRDEVAV
ncbi:acetyl-coenzyme A synthetase N-terminal domain-containing protein, partial [Streptomyces sp. NPDC002692]